MVWPTCDLIKTNISNRKCLSRLFIRGGYLKTSLFWGDRSLELDGFTLLVRIRVSDSSILNWSKDFWSLSSFPFWRKWRQYRIQALIFAISMRCQNIIWCQHFVFHHIRYNDSNMSARLTPPMHLLHCWTIWGNIIFFITSFPHHLSNSPISSTPTKLLSQV